MTPEQQRIAIAEACGWNIIEVIEGMPFGILDSHTDKSPRLVPDYLSDLNAMHEAEKVLIGKQQEYYYAELSKLGTWYDCLHATASQRAEAFLRTLNLWKD